VDVIAAGDADDTDVAEMVGSIAAPSHGDDHVSDVEAHDETPAMSTQHVDDIVNADICHACGSDSDPHLAAKVEHLPK